jgi:tubulin polyglutamylase TTLL6/13
VVKKAFEAANDKWLREGKEESVPAWIVKPSVRGGEGGLPLEQIFMVTKYEDLKSRLEMMHNGNTEWVVQRYTQDPLLVDGLKFDVRLYAVVLSIDPLKIHVCKEGICRFATETFAPVGTKMKGSTKGQPNLNAHVSSYHLNKDSPKYVPPGANAMNDDNFSSKRPLSVVFRYSDLSCCFDGTSTRFLCVLEDCYWIPTLLLA